MAYTLNPKVGKLVESTSIRIADRIRAMKAEGQNIIELQTGEPDFKTPKHIIDAAYQSMLNGRTHYTSSRGIPELREAISEKLRHDNGISADPKRNILVTPGSVHAIFSSLQAVIRPGQEVIIPSPYWVAYPNCVRMADGIPIDIPYLEQDSVDANMERIEKALSPRTGAIILNYPCNPSGHTYNRQFLEGIAEIAARNDLMVISDEIYEMIRYDGTPHNSIGKIPGMEDRTITVNGFSKSYAMTGWRVGYASAPQEVIDQMLKVLQYSVTCTSTFVQDAAVAALRGPQSAVKEMVDEFDFRRRYIIKRLNDINRLACDMPAGAFYAFPTVSGYTSEQFADKILGEAGVGCIPGSAYGMAGKGRVRFSFANSQNLIEEAMDRIEDLMSKEEN